MLCVMVNELYYWLYEYLKKIKTNDNPAFNAFIGISFFQGINVLTLVGIANYFLAFDISRNTVIYSGIIIYVSLTAINFFSLFVKRNKIIKKFEGFSAKRREKGKLYLWLYILATIALAMYVLIYLVTPKY